MFTLLNLLSKYQRGQCCSQTSCCHLDSLDEDLPVYVQNQTVHVGDKGQHSLNLGPVTRH